MREFDTGATRDTDNNKLDFEGFFSPKVIFAYAAYMHKHRKLPDGSMRESDNWQLGIPTTVYQKSLVRHVMQLWSIWRGNATMDDTGREIDKVEALCAVMFNVQGLLHEELKQRTHGS